MSLHQLACQALSRAAIQSMTEESYCVAAEHIVQLACTVFGTANALVALLDSERIIIRNGSGMFAPGDFPWRYSFCGYTLTPQNPTTMVIEDAHKDARCVSLHKC